MTTESDEWTEEERELQYQEWLELRRGYGDGAEREARCPAGLDENDPDDREFIRCVEAVRDEAAAAVTAELDAEARAERC